MDLLQGNGGTGWGLEAVGNTNSCPFSKPPEEALLRMGEMIICTLIPLWVSFIKFGDTDVAKGCATTWIYLVSPNCAVTYGSNSTSCIMWLSQLKNVKKKNRKEGFPGDTVVKNPPANAGDMGLIPDLENPTCIEQQLSNKCWAWPLEPRSCDHGACVP